MTYPDHHEGIVSADRTDDDLLSLEGVAIKRRLVMMSLVDTLYDCVLTGSPSKRAVETWQWMKSPSVGDLVMEVTSFQRVREPQSRIQGFGILLAQRKEWADSEKEWALLREEDPEWAFEGNRATVTAWYIQYGPKAGDVCRWVDCRFLAVPVNLSLL